MIKLHSTILEDEYTSYIKEHYDFDAQKANEVNVPSFHLPNGDWNIIAIIGASGSGKSTILNELSSQYGGVRKPSFDSRPIISNLGLPPKEASELLCAIGLASVPSWCRPLHNLSNGVLRHITSDIRHKEGENAKRPKILCNFSAHFCLTLAFSETLPQNCHKIAHFSK